MALKHAWPRASVPKNGTGSAFFWTDLLAELLDYGILLSMMRNVVGNRYCTRNPQHSSIHRLMALCISIGHYHIRH